MVDLAAEADLLVLAAAEIRQRQAHRKAMTAALVLLTAHRQISELQAVEAAAHLRQARQATLQLVVALAVQDRQAASRAAQSITQAAAAADTDSSTTKPTCPVVLEALAVVALEPIAQTQQ